MLLPTPVGESTDLLSDASFSHPRTNRLLELRILSHVNSLWPDPTHHDLPSEATIPRLESLAPSLPTRAWGGYWLRGCAGAGSASHNDSGIAARQDGERVRGPCVRVFREAIGRERGSGAPCRVLAASPFALTVAGHRASS